MIQGNIIGFLDPLKIKGQIPSLSGTSPKYNHLFLGPLSLALAFPKIFLKISVAVESVVRRICRGQLWLHRRLWGVADHLQEEGHLYHLGPTNPTAGGSRASTTGPSVAILRAASRKLWDCWTLVVLYTNFKNIITWENVYVDKITKNNNVAICIVVLILPLINWIRTEVRNKWLKLL